MNAVRLLPARVPRGARLALAAGLALLASACAMPKAAQVDFPDPRTVQQPVARAPQAANGSLFQPASYRPHFEDPRARLVGDTVTVLIVENVSASQKSSSTANRASSIEAGITAFPGLTFPPDTQDKITLGAGTASDFTGKGGTESAHTFSGTITTTVTEVLPNGHLVITGEKQIGVNQNVDVLRFSGSVDPRAIQPGNRVNSNQIANVRVQSRGRGAQDDAQTVGWLTRFFFNFSPF